MKRLLSYAILIFMALALISCSEDKRKKALLPNISGHAGEVIVVIDKGDWEGAVGTILRDTLGQDCKFLPQREPLYSLVNVIPSGFTNMFQIHRNIIVVNIKNDVTELWVSTSKADEKASVTVEGSKDMKVGLNKRVVVVTAENGKTHLIPVADEMIVEIDADDKSIVVELPIGLLDL